MSLAVLTTDELGALSYWPLGSLGRATLPRDGTVNRTVLLKTPKGSYALRVCRKDKQLEQVQHECAVTQHVLQKGLPVLPPVPLPNGLPYLNFKQRFYLLFPAATGQQISRALLSQHHLCAMGKCLARLTLALADYPTTGIYRRTFQFDLNKTLEKLEHLEERIKAWPNSGGDERAALERVQKQRTFLQTQQPLVNFEQLHFQVSHGDFHDGNLFFKNNDISAIIDWDQLRVVPRYFELLRTTSFLLQELEPEQVRFFVQAFLEHYPANKNELEETVKLYTAEHAHNLWVLEAIYLEGNDRARAFLRGKFAETFRGFEEEWRRLEVNI
jgi:homoserine kinase type II